MVFLLTLTYCELVTNGFEALVLFCKQLLFSEKKKKTKKNGSDEKKTYKIICVYEKRVRFPVC